MAKRVLKSKIQGNNKNTVYSSSPLSWPLLGGMKVLFFEVYSEKLLTARCHMLPSVAVLSFHSHAEPYGSPIRPVPRCPEYSFLQCDSLAS